MVNQMGMRRHDLHGKGIAKGPCKVLYQNVCKETSSAGDLQTTSARNIKLKGSETASAVWMSGCSKFIARPLPAVLDASPMNNHSYECSK